jgi:hypothetical protein
MRCVSALGLMLLLMAVCYAAADNGMGHACWRDEIRATSN